MHKSVVIALWIICFYIFFSNSMLSEGVLDNKIQPPSQVQVVTPQQKDSTPSYQQRIDSMFFLLGEQQRCIAKKQEFEILYYLKGREKYRLKANKYVDSAYWFDRKLQDFTKKH